ncbi:hypothetical protein [Paludisphaera mucosa]|uniref:Uncharacterized protein n=1 Tax=Paludisphaera mucosa TaxID=3030827 RepID=A0ABT6FC47_9BACT|nr:hypothetical protein [Paludisphaera mucosa]MDG3005163.1 hypothetical protein [Paludisphaera mucosa]
MTSPAELLDLVADRDSLIALVKVLAAERAEAAEIERAAPQTYVLDGAHGWKNAGIDDFLLASLVYFEPKPYHSPESEPSWRMFAEFLWYGKIYE